MTDTTAHETSAEDARRMRILQGAKQAFLAYGFQRTTMDDIARAAEISRPALYLMFKNKTDIYRALASVFGAEFVATAREALRGQGTLAERLEKLLDCIIATLGEIDASPHGHELLDMKNNLAEDIIAEWRSEMLGLVAAAIEQEQAKRGAGAPSAASAQTLANMLMDALDGMKLRRLPLDEQHKTAAAFVKVIADAAGA